MDVGGVVPLLHPLVVVEVAEDGLVVVESCVDVLLDGVEDVGGINLGKTELLAIIKPLSFKSFPSI